MFAKNKVKTNNLKKWEEEEESSSSTIFFFRHNKDFHLLPHINTHSDYAA